MTARTRIEAADAVVSVQAEGVDQATKKIKEVDKAIGALPAAAKAADAAAEASGKRWQELAGKVGAAVGAFASVQAMDLSTSSGLMGLAGVAAMATAALGPVGIAVTAVAAAVNLLSNAMDDTGPPSNFFLDHLGMIRKRAEETTKSVDTLTKITGGWISTLSGAQGAEAVANVEQIEKLSAKAKENVAERAMVAERLAASEKRLAEHAYAYVSTYERPEYLRAELARIEASNQSVDASRAALEQRNAELEAEAKATASARGLTKEVESKTAAVKAATFSWAEYVDKLGQVRAGEQALFGDLESSRKAKQDADKAEFDRAVDLMLWAEQTRADEASDAKKAIAGEKRGLRELQGALADFYQWKAEERQRDLDTAMAVNSAALNATVAVAGAFGASEATMNRIKGVSAAADAILYGAKAYNAAGGLNPWSAVQFGLAAVASAAASVAYFQAAGGGGGASASPSVPSGGGSGGVSAPPENRGAGDGGGTTINVSFDRAQRPLTRGDERAIYAGVSRALSGPGGARGLGSRRVAS